MSLNYMYMYGDSRPFDWLWKDGGQYGDGRVLTAAPSPKGRTQSLA